MAGFSTHWYQWWPKDSKKPAFQDFLVDSHDCILSSLDFTKTHPVALCFRRNDDDDGFPRTDDDEGPTSQYVTTDFSSFAGADAFLDSVRVGQEFSVVTELMARDTPRKQSVVLCIPPDPDRMETSDDTRSLLLSAVAPVIRAMASLSNLKRAKDDKEMFAEYSVSVVSKPLFTAEANPRVVIVRNVDRWLADADRHANYAEGVAARLAAPLGFTICSPDAVFSETVHGVEYCGAPVPRSGDCGHPAFHLTRERQASLRECVNGKVVMHRLKDSVSTDHFLGFGKRRDDRAAQLSLSSTPEYTGALISELPADSVLSMRWRIGLEQLGVMIHSSRITPDTTRLAAATPVFGRWTCTGGECPLCCGSCAHVDLRLKSVAGLMATCGRCPQGSGPIAGPLYVSRFGELTGDSCVTVPTLIDDRGVPRMTPVSSYKDQVPADTACVPTGRPGSGKTHGILRHIT